MARAKMEMEVEYNTVRAALAYRAMAIGIAEVASLFNEAVAEINATAQMLEDLATGDLPMDLSDVDLEVEDDND